MNNNLALEAFELFVETMPLETMSPDHPMFNELYEKLAAPRVPVPLHSIPVTVDVPTEDADELLTDKTRVLSFAFVVVVPPNTIPFSV